MRWIIGLCFSALSGCGGVAESFTERTATDQQWVGGDDFGAATPPGSCPCSRVASGVSGAAKIVSCQIDRPGFLGLVGTLRGACVATRIARGVALTAAHCVGGGESTSPKRIWFKGWNDWKDATAERHPHFEPPNGKRHDIAVLTWEEEGSADTVDLESGTILTARTTSYGDGANSTSLELERVTTTCRDNEARWSRCGGYRISGEEAKPGDSGGPLLHRGKLIGIVSHERRAERLSYYWPWIQSVINRSRAATEATP